jgi:hypothetical protein
MLHIPRYRLAPHGYVNIRLKQEQGNSENQISRGMEKWHWRCSSYHHVP